MGGYYGLCDVFKLSIAFGILEYQVGRGLDEELPWINCEILCISNYD
jgi:hypothetical protein